MRCEEQASEDSPKTEVAGKWFAPKMFWTLGKLLAAAGVVEKVKLEPELAPAGKQASCLQHLQRSRTLLLAEGAAHQDTCHDQT
jgi:hypothetical protein